MAPKATIVNKAKGVVKKGRFVKALLNASRSVDLTVVDVSGETLASISAETKLTGADVKKAVRSRCRLPQGSSIGSLLSGETVLQDSQTIKQLGITSGAMLQAVIHSRPSLHLVEPCSAPSLAGRHGGWCADGNADCESEGESEGGFCEKNIRHDSMDVAPEAAREVAKEMLAALGKRELTIVVSESVNSTREIFVISGQAENPKEAVLGSLAVRRRGPNMDGDIIDYWDLASVENKDWSTDAIDIKSNEEAQKIGSAISDVMAKKLTHHFEITFDDDIVVAPHVIGGVASDGSIVGILQGRTWT